MTSLLIITTVPGTIRAFVLPLAHHFREKGWKVHAMACGISENAECLQAFNRMARMSARNLEKAIEYTDEMLGKQRNEFYRYVRDMTEAWLKEKN